MAELDDFQNWVYIDEANEDFRKIIGRFQAAFVFDPLSTNVKKKDPSAPD